MKTLELSCRKACCFEGYGSALTEVHKKKACLLADCCMGIISCIVDDPGMDDTEIRKESALDVGADVTFTLRIMGRCKNAGVDTCHSGTGAADYHETDVFEKHEIDVIYTGFEPFKYSQLWSKGCQFGLSVIECLCECGGNSFRKDVEHLL